MSLGAAMRGVAHGHFGLRLAGGPMGLPGDFLIAPSGQIEAVKYGTHAYDQWSVDELIARQGRRPTGGLKGAGKVPGAKIA